MTLTFNDLAWPIRDLILRDVEARAIWDAHVNDPCSIDEDFYSDLAVMLAGRVNSGTSLTH